jgi:UDP-GlcNAc3NAcA epimerase
LKITSIVGARPQFVKAAAVIRALEARSSVQHVLVHTGQHYDDNMSEIFFRELEIPRPDYCLGVGSAPHGAQTGRMLESLERVVTQTVPDWVLAYGDTNSTLAAALAAVKLHISVGHVEAGLRSWNRRMPEEINRVLTDHASDLLFAPTATAVENLRREGIPQGRIVFTGDVMYDTAVFYGEKADAQSRILQKLSLRPGSYILATIHRAENTDDNERLASIFHGLERVAQEIPVVLPLHPRTRNALKEMLLLGNVEERLLIIDPVGYLDMVMLERKAHLIATDSGGVQKEAFFYQVPCATLRDETEWVELIELGWNRLVRPDSPEAIFEGVLSMLETCGSPGFPFGEGNAAAKIVEALNQHGNANQGDLTNPQSTCVS